jgi:hypothetical protein
MTRMAIVIIAFDRPKSLRRLLRSLAATTQHVDNCPALVISIDGGESIGRSQCLAEAESFEWPSEKRVITHNAHLGLRNHVISCGDLSQEFGAVIVLEDDICISPMAVHFAEHAVRKYGNSRYVGGISLYSFSYNEFANVPFTPVDDGWDTFFARTGSSSGQVWTGKQWADFRAWLSRNNCEAAIPLPGAARAWPSETSWKRAFNFYLADMGRYVVFPRFSMSTNMGDVGQHHPGVEITHLTPALSVARKNVRFAKLSDSVARYDPFLEIEPECLKALAPSLRNYDFDVDLTGTKELKWLTSPLTLTCRGAKSPPICGFGFKHFPPELNIVFEESGSVFALRRRDDLLTDAPREVLDRMRSFYANAGQVQIDSLNKALKESEADRAARLDQINILTNALKESEVDRAGRLDQINILTNALKESDQRA